ncbi:MAG TPA: IS3 family transposase [Caulobacteraceae bacterium]
MTTGNANPTRRPYPREFRTRAVELARTSDLTPAQLARDLGVDSETLQRWLQQADIDAGHRAGLTTEEKAELARLRREVRVLREEREILKQAAPFFRPGERDVTDCYRFITAEAGHHAIALLCRALKVSRSGYYAWRDRPPSARAQADRRLTERIRQVHQASRGAYGSPRVHTELRLGGERCARKRVARLMRLAGLRSCHGRRRRMRTTAPDRQATPAPDRVERAFTPAAIGAPNRLWVADISYVATLEGWLYLAVVLDAFSRRVVGWAMADHLRTDLVVDALDLALQSRRPPPGLIHHTDRGCQYTSLAFGQRLQAAGRLASMGAVGTCYDNAVAERFFATLKVELLHRQVWPTRAAAERAIFEYIIVWYNRQRRHSTLGYATPVEFEVLAWEAPAA